jgi:Uma2 family endonuclease
LELVRKRELYARFGVPENWYADLEVDRVEVYRLAGGDYPPPVFAFPAEVLKCAQLPGSSISVGEALALRQDGETGAV